MPLERFVNFKKLDRLRSFLFTYAFYCTFWGVAFEGDIGEHSETGDDPANRIGRGNCGTLSHVRNTESDIIEME